MKKWQVLGGFAAGAGLVYLSDPRSRRRVAQALQDAAHKLRRLAGQAADIVQDGAPDDLVAARVRAVLARFASHPHAVTTAVEDGVVTLSGPVLADDAGALLAAACRVRGVHTVVDRLEVHEAADGIPELQGTSSDRGP